jgi:uncharacterized membrane protein YciS (DUF1049 family)
MIRKIVLAVVLIPLAILIVALAVANREIVTVSFDPFSTAQPAFVLRRPLFELIFVLVIAGVIIGGIASWLRQGKWRRAARLHDAELRAARNEVDRLRRELAARETAAAPPLALRPPAA